MSKEIQFKLYLKIHWIKHTRFAVWHVHKHVARGKILRVTPGYVITSVPHAWPRFLTGGLVNVQPIMIIDLHSSDDICSSSKPCASCKSVKQTNMPVPYFHMICVLTKLCIAYSSYCPFCAPASCEQLCNIWHCALYQANYSVPGLSTIK